MPNNRLDERQGPKFVRDLLYAETDRHGVSPSSVEMTTAVHVADGGVDAFTDFPFDIRAVGIPAGRLVWQVKTGNKKPSASPELGKAAKHDAAQREVAAGAGYVLVWTSDQPRETRLDVQQVFLEEARNLRSDAVVYVLVADDVAAWAWRHPQVFIELVPLEGLRPIGQLTGAEVENGTTDVERRIRSYFERPMGRALRVVGPTGSGKSTAVRLAANTLPGNLDVLIARNPSGAGTSLLTRLAHRRIDVGIVIERCSPEQAGALEHLVADSDDHLRLITEGVEPGLSYLQKTIVVEVRPMMANVDRRLLESLGVPGPLLSELMGSTGGNPMLLTALARGEHELSSDVFERLTDGLDIRALASFAIMPPLGTDQWSLEMIASLSEVTVETLEDTAAALADRQLIPGAGYPRLPPALASAALRKAFASRRSWISRLLPRLPNEFVPVAVEPLAAAGRSAESFIINLLERADALLLESSEEDQAFELLDLLGLAVAAIPAAPVVAAQRLNRLARQYPWPREPGLSMIATQEFIRAAERLDNADETHLLGTRLLLEVIAASGFRSGQLRTALRSMVGVDPTNESPRMESIRRIAEELGGNAIEELDAAHQP